MGMTAYSPGGMGPRIERTWSGNPGSGPNPPRSSVTRCYRITARQRQSGEVVPDGCDGMAQTHPSRPDPQTVAHRLSNDSNSNHLLPCAHTRHTLTRNMGRLTHGLGFLQTAAGRAPRGPHNGPETAHAQVTTTGALNGNRIRERNIETGQLGVVHGRVHRTRYARHRETLTGRN